VINQNFPFGFGELGAGNCQAFVASLPRGIRSKNDLLSALSEKLDFPEYFGFNWNALEDCLTDFSWIAEHKIILIHQELPELADQELTIYFAILRDSVLDWKKGEAHRLKVVFAESDQCKVRELLGGLGAGN
jgi:RNAse (barnase) inhibitor barstar